MDRLPRVTWAMLALLPGSLGALAGPTGAVGPEAMKAAGVAQRAGDAAAAEAAYRQAWRDPSSREDAAAALRAMYERGNAAPTVDAPALARAREQLGPDFLLTETRWFVVLSDADQAWTRQRAAMLERARHQFFRVMDRLEVPVYPPEHKLLCILINDFERYRAFSRAEDGTWAEWVAGYYSPRDNRIVFYNDSTSPQAGRAAAAIDGAAGKVKELRGQAAKARRDGQAQYAAALDASAAELESRVRGERGRLTEAMKSASAAKTIHEAIHLLAFNTGLQSAAREYPFWLSEGLASCFETDDPNAGAFGPDHVALGRGSGIENDKAAGSPLPLERLVGLISVPAEPGEDASEDDVAAKMYSQSRDLFAYLYRYRRRELRGYFESFLREPAEPLGADRQKMLFSASFGEPAALDRRLKPN